MGTPFRQWYEAHYGVTVGRKKKKETEGAAEEPKKQSKSVVAKIAKRQEARVLDPNINSQFDTGRLLACISSRPGQCGRCDGYVLEGKELEFYVKRMAREEVELVRDRVRAASVRGVATDQCAVPTPRLPLSGH